MVALAALAIGISRPASTEAILTDTGAPLAGSVAELTSVSIGGHDQAVMIRGDSTTNPVLLFLAGGPGGTELGAMRRHGQALEKDFVVVTWDQRGTGKSYDTLDPTATLTLPQAVSDTIEVTNYLRGRFGQDKIYLLGQSWGTILGVLAVQQHPELYRAYIGVGQMVDPRDTDETFYRDTLAWARRTGNASLADQLTDTGPPPYTDMLDYEPTLTNDNQIYPYDHSHNSEGAGGFSDEPVRQRVHPDGAAARVRRVLRRLHRPLPAAAGHRLPHTTPPASPSPSTWSKDATRPPAGSPQPSSGSTCSTPPPSTSSSSTPPGTGRCSNNPTSSTS